MGFRVLPIMTALLVVVQIILANQVAGSGKEIRAIDQSISTLQWDNEQLELAVASESSLISIAQKAHELGFVEPSQSQYLSVAPETFPVALNDSH